MAKSPLAAGTLRHWYAAAYSGLQQSARFHLWSQKPGYRTAQVSELHAFNNARQVVPKNPYFYYAQARLFTSATLSLLRFAFSPTLAPGISGKRSKESTNLSTVVPTLHTLLRLDKITALLPYFHCQRANDMSASGLVPLDPGFNRIQTSSHFPFQKRCFSSGQSNVQKKQGNHKLNEDTGNASKEESSKQEGDESMDPRAFLLGTRESLRKVTEFQAGDMMATYAIVLLLAMILISPVAIRYMRGSESTYDELDTDDQVLDMAHIIRRDFLQRVSEDGTILEDKGVVDTVLADVLSSKALQGQAIKFVVTILESKEVKATGQRFLKDLWDDLIKDPETTAQVIFLLNVAIQNEDIRLAVKTLVLEIVEDEEVLEEMVRLLQKLGQDQEVLAATQTLLSESAHNALNDPEVLDHSMEFATDVVGDDVVQRTAGDALRNTISYAVKPSITILLAMTGVGLLFFSVLSLGYATRPSEKEAAVFYDAVSGVVEPLSNAICMPVRIMGSAVKTFFNTVLLPFHFMQRIIAQIEYTSSAANRAVQTAAGWAAGTFYAFCDRILSANNALSTSIAMHGSEIERAVSGTVSCVSKKSIGVVSLIAVAGKGLKGWTITAWAALSSFFSSANRSAGLLFQEWSVWMADASARLRQGAILRVMMTLDAASNFFMIFRVFFF